MEKYRLTIRDLYSLFNDFGPGTIIKLVDRNYNILFVGNYEQIPEEYLGYALDSFSHTSRYLYIYIAKEV